MFTLSGLFLEDGEKLFQDFWSLFSISFLSFSARWNYLKKSEPTPGRNRPGLLGPAFKARETEARASPAATRALTLIPPPAAAATIPRRRPRRTRQTSPDPR